jgi:hypothetical protein
MIRASACERQRLAGGASRIQTALRSYVLGDEAAERAATEEETRRMARDSLQTKEACEPAAAARKYLLAIDFLQSAEIDRHVVCEAPLEGKGRH